MLTPAAAPRKASRTRSMASRSRLSVDGDMARERCLQVSGAVTNAAQMRNRYMQMQMQVWCQL